MRDSLGARVRTLRTKAGWSQVELAKAAECEQTLISRIEARKDYEPGTFSLYRVARALGTTIDGLLDGVIEFTPAPVVKNGAPPEMVARMGEEIAVLHKNVGNITETLAQVADTVAQVSKDVAEMKRGQKQPVKTRR